MKYYDITQELFSSNVYPGDKAPAYKRISDMADGRVCNITELEMNAHNGTHIDAPRHFVRDGLTIEQLPLETLIGECEVVTFDHPLEREDLEALNLAERGVKRLLCRGKCWLTMSAAKYLTEEHPGVRNHGVLLVGVETQSVAPEEAPMAVHVQLLSHGIIALEGLVLTDVPDGTYTLFAAPLKLGGSDGSPCRAVLMAD
ncbi:MAG: cyclase family protein [Clostridia bacterium]|nr:cyclase family protein [Clostridia bacterium]MBQ9996425.1 cyclase family protein [Clostridia bacterium]